MQRCLPKQSCPSALKKTNVTNEKVNYTSGWDYESTEKGPRSWPQWGQMKGHWPRKNYRRPVQQTARGGEYCAKTFSWISVSRPQYSLPSTTLGFLSDHRDPSTRLFTLSLLPPTIHHLQNPAADLIVSKFPPAWPPRSVIFQPLPISLSAFTLFHIRQLKCILSPQRRKMTFNLSFLWYLLTRR